MARAVKWIKKLLSSSNKEKEKCKTSNNESRSGPLPMVGPKEEKRRWSFRRSSTGTRMEHKSADRVALLDPRVMAEPTRAVEIDSAVTIQTFFRSHLARKALCALKGLVKLQALIRGQLVRREATTTLNSIQALVNAEIRSRAKRILMLDEKNDRRSQDEYRSRRQSYEMEENVKILEIDHGEYRSSSNSRDSYRRDLRLPTYWGEPYQEVSPARSNLTDRSPRAVSGGFGGYSFIRGSSIPDLRKSSPTMSQDYPNYMANTKSSRAKARSHSAPKQRPSVEGKNILGGTRQQYSIKLDRSSISLQESDCGSSNTRYPSIQTLKL